MQKNRMPHGTIEKGARSLHTAWPRRPRAMARLHCYAQTARAWRPAMRRQARSCATLQPLPSPRRASENAWRDTRVRLSGACAARAVLWARAVNLKLRQNATFENLSSGTRLKLPACINSTQFSAQVSSKQGCEGTCSVQEQRHERRRVQESAAHLLIGFPHHRPLAARYLSRRVGYLYSASSPGGLGRC